MFEFYIVKFKLNGSKEDFEKAEEIFVKIESIRKVNPDNITISNYTKMTQAILFRFGSLTKRAKALQLFEELLDVFPFDVANEYLGLLFDDLMIAQDQETLDKIDFLMNSYITKPSKFYHILIFISQQILVARYNFFIKDNLNKGLEILIEARKEISALKLDFLESRIETEISRFKEERDKWDQADLTITERIEKSEFQKYIQKGLKIKMD